MSVLLLHPEDSPFEGPWANRRWDLVVDLGWAGQVCYARWAEKLGCPVRSFYDLMPSAQALDGLKELLRAGQNRLLDGEGIDWWDVLAPNLYLQLFELVLLRALAIEIAKDATVQATRGHRLLEALEVILGRRIGQVQKEDSPGSWRQLQRYAKLRQVLTPAQSIEIAFDKWDTDYSLRRWWNWRGATRFREQKILVPSAYGNVSRMAMAYAAMLPEQRFLLVTTRHSGELQNLPCNVEHIPLASYVPLRRESSTEREIVALTKECTKLIHTLAREPGFSALPTALEGLPAWLPACLRIRDAWRRVLEQEPLAAVFCGDQNNRHTRLPVLLAKRRNIRTIYFHHGALDFGMWLREPCFDSYLVKGEMEREYLTDFCGAKGERVFIGAPAEARSAVLPRQESFIGFFSEPYEIYFGRTEELYLDVLPPLCRLAREQGRKVMVKLHPFESLTARTALAERILQPEDRTVLQVIKAPMTSDFLRRMWFGLTVKSSVAVECALAEIPCFLCGWFNVGPDGYMEQFVRYGAARMLTSPQEIGTIPQILSASLPTGEALLRLYQPASAQRLAAIFNDSLSQTDAAAGLSATRMAAQHHEGPVE